MATATYGQLNIAPHGIARRSCTEMTGCKWLQVSCKTISAWQLSMALQKLWVLHNFQSTESALSDMHYRHCGGRRRLAYVHRTDCEWRKSDVGNISWRPVKLAWRKFVHLEMDSIQHLICRQILVISSACQIAILILVRQHFLEETLYNISDFIQMW